MVGGCGDCLLMPGIFWIGDLMLKKWKLKPHFSRPFFIFAASNWSRNEGTVSPSSVLYNKAFQIRVFPFILTHQSQDFYTAELSFAVFHTLNGKVKLLSQVSTKRQRNEKPKVSLGRKLSSFLDLKIEKTQKHIL